MAKQTVLVTLSNSGGVLDIHTIVGDEELGHDIEAAINEAVLALISCGLRVGDIIAVREG